MWGITSRFSAKFKVIGEPFYRKNYTSRVPVYTSFNSKAKKMFIYCVNSALAFNKNRTQIKLYFYILGMTTTYKCTKV